jgi:hypothetical protein
METGLFEIQADHLSGFRQARQVQQPLERLFYALFGRAESASFDRDAAPANITNGIESFAGSAPKSVELAADPAAKLARCFLRLANLPNYALDRLSRYEATLWRQVRQIVLRLMPWIAANHKTEGAVSVSAVGKACRPMSPRNVSFQACRSRHCSTRLAFDRE